MTKKSWLLILRLWLAGALTQLGAILFTYISYKQAMQQDGPWVELSAGLTSVMSYMLALLTLPILIAWIMRLPNWLRTGFVPGAAQFAAAYFLMRYVEMTFRDLAMVCAAAGLLVVATWAVGRLADKRLRPAMAFIVTGLIIIVSSAGLAWTVGEKLEKTQAATELAREQANIKTMLKTIDFPIYLPQTPPKGYEIIKITPTHDKDIAISKAPNALTFYLSDNGGKSSDLVLYEFKAVSSYPTYNPPRECGPYDAQTLLAGPSDASIPCHEVARVGQTAVYENADTYISPVRYSYYFRLGSTQLAIDSNDMKLNASELTIFVTGLKSVGVNELPQQLLSEY